MYEHPVTTLQGLAGGRINPERAINPLAMQQREASAEAAVGRNKWKNNDRLPPPQIIEVAVIAVGSVLVYKRVGSLRRRSSKSQPSQLEVYLSAKKE